MWDIPIHEGINRSDNLHREGMHHKRIKEKKSDYDKFNNQQSGGGAPPLPWEAGVRQRCWRIGGILEYRLLRLRLRL